ncbi:hypothetical protein KCU88_g263, partial [Aureobasidium melanogenum]
MNHYPAGNRALNQRQQLTTNKGCGGKAFRISIRIWNDLESGLDQSATILILLTRANSGPAAKTLDDEAYPSEREEQVIHRCKQEVDTYAPWTQSI